MQMCETDTEENEENILDLRYRSEEGMPYNCHLTAEVHGFRPACGEMGEGWDRCARLRT